MFPSNPHPLTAGFKERILPSFGIQESLIPEYTLILFHRQSNPFLKGAVFAGELHMSPYTFSFPSKPCTNLLHSVQKQFSSAQVEKNHMWKMSVWVQIKNVYFLRNSDFTVRIRNSWIWRIPGSLPLGLKPTCPRGQREHELCLLLSWLPVFNSPDRHNIASISCLERAD